jgi:hypothetical protein
MGPAANAERKRARFNAHPNICTRDASVSGPERQCARREAEKRRGMILRGGFAIRRD